MLGRFHPKHHETMGGKHTGAGSRQKHVRRNLTEKIANKKDRHGSLVLGTREVEVFFKIVDPGERNRVSMRICQHT